MENVIVLAIFTFGLIMVFMASGMWISGALGLVGVILLTFFVGRGQESMIGPILFNTINSFTFTAIPLFVFMGEIILHSGLSDKLYKGATKLVGFFPGGLLHTNIAACSLFAAVSGSSMATAATIGTVALPELEKRKYNRRLMYGSLAGGGTLGVLIPPSIPLIIYGAIVGESVGRLFMAGVFPGLILAGLFMCYIGGTAILRPHLVPDRLRFSLRSMASSVFDLWSIIVLIFIVLGTIYLGLATPTEAASLGAFTALVFCALYRRLTWQVLKESGLSALRVACWAMLIVIGAQVLAMGLSFLKVPAQLAAMVSSWPVHRMVTLVGISFLYLLLGTMMDAIPMILLTLPVIAPIMESLGFSAIWFGIVLVIYVEMGQITPPVGVNLFVIHGLTGRKNLGDIILGVVPFLVCQVVLLILLAAFPNIAIWLPSKMFR